MRTCLWRIVFCLFADDSDIFNRNQFSNYLKNETREDGSDLVDRLAALFQVLNTPEDKCFQLEVPKEFPYISLKWYTVTTCRQTVVKCMK